MNVRFCDERGRARFSWVVSEPMTRTSHALGDGSRVWLIDPVDWPEAIDRARSLGKITAVVQLLDRHNRDGATIAERLDVPLLVVPASLPGTPFEIVSIRDSKRWHEVALWWPDTRTLVVAEAIGTNGFFTGGSGAAGVHLLLRLTPPRTALGSFQPEHLLVGHGEGLHGRAAAAGLRAALAGSRRRLPFVLLRMPFMLRG